MLNCDVLNLKFSTLILGSLFLDLIFTLEGVSSIMLGPLLSLIVVISNCDSLWFGFVI